ATAADLAGDLQRFLAGEPIVARPPTRAERLWRWCRRRPTLSVLTAAAAVTLLVVVPVGLWYEASLQTAKALAAAAREAEDQAHKAAAEARRAEAAALEAATTQEYYSLLNRVRERNTSPRLGWTWDGLDDLARAAPLRTVFRNP